MPLRTVSDMEVVSTPMAGNSNALEARRPPTKRPGVFACQDGRGSQPRCGDLMNRAQITAIEARIPPMTNAL